MSEVVTDAATGEPVTSAVVMVKAIPTKGTETDMEGRWRLDNLPRGIIRSPSVSSPTRASRCRAGWPPMWRVDVRLESDSEEVEEVVVKDPYAERHRDSHAPER